MNHGSELSDGELLRAFETQVRRSLQPDPGMRVEVVTDPAPMLLLLPANETAWGGGVMWSDLSEETADAAIDAAVEIYAGSVPPGVTPKDWEWKLYADDQPADLPDRLLGKGFEAEDVEALVLGEVDVVRRQLAAAPEPDGVTIRRIRDDKAGLAADWRGIADLDTAVWGEDGTERAESLAAALAADPDSMSVWVAEALDATIVCAARVQFHHGTDFASLWGGSTLEQWRGRGIYKALVSRRADEAAARGFTYLQVDASPDSRPILERLGMRAVTTTTPWTRKH